MKTASIEIVPYFDDNYSYLIHCNASGKTALVDCGDFGPVHHRLQEKKWSLDMIMLTHSHYDHAGDIQSAIDKWPELKIVKPAGDNRISLNGLEVVDEDQVELGGLKIDVISVPAHTKYCTSYRIDNRIFSGDALFSAGCGRLFEGTAVDLELAMDRFLSFDDDTMFYVGHEYTLSNLEFAASIEPHSDDISAYKEKIKKLIPAGGFSTPTLISTEKKVNPFFRIDHENVIQAIDPENRLSRTERMGILRNKKDNF